MTDATACPIILIGAARSGTKFLRDVLATAPGTAAVPYDVNYVWRYGVTDHPDDALNPAALTDRQRRFVRRILPKLAKAAAADVLVEKTVSNTLRVPYVDAIYPQARYVHLIRDGRDVTESAMRLWQAPPDMKALWTKLRGMPLSNAGYAVWFAKNFATGLISGRKGGKVWGPRFPGIFELSEEVSLAEICARQWVESVTAASRDLAALPDAESRVCEIRYEDLIGGEDALRRLAGQLDLTGAEDTILAALRKRLRPSKPAQWKDLPSEDQATLDRVLTPMLTEKGYHAP